MTTLEWHCRRREGVTLVELLVESDVEARVHIESLLEPVWPPRRYGVPAEGWNGTRYEGIVGPNRRLLLGYATPAEPADPPAKIVSTEPGVETRDTERLERARGIVRALGRARPARDVVRGTDTTDVQSGDTSPNSTPVEDSPPLASASVSPVTPGVRETMPATDEETIQSHQPPRPRSDSASITGLPIDSGAVGGETQNPASESPRTMISETPQDTANKTRPEVADETSPEVADETSPEVADETSPEVADETSPEVTDETSPGSASDASPDAASETPHNAAGSFHRADESQSADTIEALDEPADPHRECGIETDNRGEMGNAVEDDEGCREAPGTSRDPAGHDGAVTSEDDGSTVDSHETHDDPADPSLDAIDRRVSAAEHLAGVTTVREAREAIERFGGIDELRTLQTDLARDRQALERASKRQESLVARLGRIEIPLTVLERLA